METSAQKYTIRTLPVIGHRAKQLRVSLKRSVHTIEFYISDCFRKDKARIVMLQLQAGKVQVTLYRSQKMPGRSPRVALPIKLLCRCVE